MNVRAAMGSRLMTYEWRMFAWGLRIQQACRIERMTFKRKPRWLARSFARELSWMWGHLGGAAQLTRGQGAEYLFR